MASAIASVLAYMDVDRPTPEQHRAMLEKSSTAIEELRGVFKNVPLEGDPDGAYPMEPMREIFQALRKLGHREDLSPQQRMELRQRFYEMWKRSRERLLAEFDRDVPTTHHAQYSGLLPTSD